MEYVGKVLKKLYSPGSKSEREAVMVRIDGREFLLRRRDGNPFYDESLNELVGKTIRGEGELISTTLILDRWEECPEDRSRSTNDEREE